MPLETLIQEIGDSDKRLSTTQLANLSHMDADDTRVLAEAWPDFEVNRRFAIVQEMIELAQDNVELNFDAVFKTRPHGRRSRRARRRPARPLRVRGPRPHPRLVELLREDADADVRREAAIALGRYALAAELGNLRDSDTRRDRRRR